MSGDHVELLRRLGALSERFLTLSARLTDAGTALAERRTLPPESLDDEIAAVHAEFQNVCATASAVARSLRIALPGGNGIAGLRDLALVVKAILETAQRRAVELAHEPQRRAAEESRRAAEAEATARRRAEEEARRAEERAPAAPAADEPGDALDLDTARWWISASASLTSIRSRRLSFEDAVKQELAKYSYVFSVPIQRSADYEDGLLAYGYALLLAHLEQGVGGFVADALGRLPPAKGVPLGQRLFRYLAEQGRLSERYADFIKAVMLAAIPEPGLWTEAAISDTRAATTIMRRATATVGEHAIKQQALSQDAQRFAPHRFATSVAPFTSRFFRVEAGELRESRDVTVTLTEAGAPSESAWLVAVRAGRGAGSQAMRLDRGGASVPGLGRDYGGIWIGVFNADAAADKRFELTVQLKRSAPSFGKGPARGR